MSKTYLEKQSSPLQMRNESGGIALNPANRNSPVLVLSQVLHINVGKIIQFMPYSHILITDYLETLRVFLFRNNSLSTFSGDKLLRRAVTVAPAALNTRSAGTDVPGVSAGNAKHPFRQASKFGESMCLHFPPCEWISGDGNRSFSLIIRKLSSDRFLFAGWSGFTSIWCS